MYKVGVGGKPDGANKLLTREQQCPASLPPPPGQSPQKQPPARSSAYPFDFSNKYLQYYLFSHRCQTLSIDFLWLTGVQLSPAAHRRFPVQKVTVLRVFIWQN